MRIGTDSCLARLAGLLLSLLLHAGAAQAATFDPYVIPDLVISADAEDAVTAKEAALSDGLRGALARVFARIAPAGDLARLPRPDAATAELLLDHLAFVSERVAPQSYRATVRVAFSPIAVRGYLTKRGVPVADQPAPPVLVIPVLVEDGIPMWWDKAARWAAALGGRDMEEGLTPVHLPRNSGEDRKGAPDRLLSADRISLDSYRVRYRVHGVAVVRAETVPGRERVVVSVIGEDAAGPVDLREEVASGGLEAAADRVAAILSERWKAALAGTLSVAGGEQALAVQVLLHGGSEEWTDIRRRLDASGVVDGVSVERMTGTDANLVLWHSGAPSDLADRLAELGLDLFQAGGSWLLQSY